MVTLVVSGIPSLVAITVAARHLGAEQFGYVALVAALPAMANFVITSGGAAVVNRVAQEGPEAARPLIRRALRTSSTAAAGVLTIAALVALGPGWERLLGIPPDALPGTNAAMIASIALWGIVAVANVGRRVLVGQGRISQATLGLVVVGPVSLVVTLALIGLDAPAFLFALAQTLGNAVGAVLVWHRAERSTGLRLLRLWREAWQPRKYRQERGLAVAVAVLTGAGAMSVATRADPVVLSYRSSPEEIATYSLVTQYSASLLTVLDVAAQKLWPHYAAQGGRLRTREFTGHVLAFVAVGAVVAAAFALAVPPAARVLLSGTAELGPPLAAAAGSVILARSARLPAAMYLTHSRGFALVAACSVTMLLGKLGASWLLAEEYGAAGVLFATAMAMGLLLVAPTTLVAAVRIRRLAHARATPAASEA
jgi:O-antigen/teichoic acid export membrane protein